MKRLIFLIPLLILCAARRQRLLPHGGEGPGDPQPGYCEELSEYFVGSQ